MRILSPIKSFVTSAALLAVFASSVTAQPATPAPAARGARGPQGPQVVSPEVTTDRLDAIQEMLQYATAGMRPLELALAGGGAFPSAQRPRVLRLEVTAGPDLELLQDRLERGSEQIGFAPEGRPFRPHITLGRVREGHRLPPGAMQRVESLPGGAPFFADQVVLFESQQGSGGPSYSVRLAQALAG